MVDKPAIIVENLGKYYTLGGPREQHPQLRDAIANALKSPLKRFQQRSPPQGFWALKDISFEVAEGEVIGIIGRNGAGKSTLLKIISRITAPTEGIVRINGRVGSLLEVGTGFHPEMTGRENIFLNGSILGMRKSEIEQKFDEIVSFSEVEKFIDTPVKRYSSGMYVRLAFAVAAHMEPDILVVDEVLAVGDVTFQKKCMGKMGDVAKEGRTVLFVSHNMGAVRALCPKSILLSNGRLVQFGNSRSVLETYFKASELSATSTDEVSIPLEVHAHGGHITRFLTVTLYDINNNPVRRVGYKKPFIIRITADFKKNVDNCRLGVGFETQLGERISVFYNTDCGDGLHSFERGKAQWDIVFKDNIFSPGIYRFGFNIMKSAGDPTLSGEGIENIPPMVTLEVSDQEPGCEMHSRFSVGPVELTAEWLVRPI